MLKLLYKTFKGYTMKLIPYISSNNSLEQINTYVEVLNATLIDHNPLQEQFKSSFVTSELALDKTTIHAHIKMFDQELYFTDARKDTSFGNNITLCFNFDSSEEEVATEFFNNLASIGTILMPLEKQFWGASYGMVCDKFNIMWHVNITA